MSVRIRAVKTAHLDDAHVGDIVGALGTVRRQQMANASSKNPAGIS